MILIIDGYNLLKQLFPHEKNSLSKRKKQLIENLNCYKAQKAKVITDIVLVFDGGLFPHPSREMESGVRVVYSGHKSIADTWIIGYVERNQHKELMVVTRDKALGERCKRMGAQVIGGDQFYKVLCFVIADKREKDQQVGFSNDFFQKYEESNYVDDVIGKFDDDERRAYDSMMEQVDVDGAEKDEGYDGVGGRGKPSGFKQSKKKRQQIKKLKKLL